MALLLVTLVAQTPARANDSGPSGPAAATDTAAPAQTAAPPGTGGDEVAGDSVDCATGAAVAVGDPGADLADIAAGFTPDGDLLFRIFTFGDPAALVAAGIFSLAYEVAFTIPSTGERLVAYDQSHDGLHESQVVDDEGRVVAGTEVSTAYVSLGEPSAPADEFGGFVEMRVRKRPLRIEDVTAAPMPLQTSSYWMEAVSSPRHCDRLDREDVSIVLLDGTQDTSGLFGFPITVTTTTPTTAALTTAESPSASREPASLPATEGTGSARAAAIPDDDGTDGPPALRLLLWILALVGLLGGLLASWRSRGREARAADCLERLFEQGATTPGAQGR